jgi:3-hydroxyacyl-CoA dehydrogenase/enoyl-CoA hydratase/3-hydroxybutyryl-CoA epimerase
VRIWDKKGYRGSTGLLDPAVAGVMMTQPALLAAKTQRNYPAPIAILTALFEGMLMPFDKALQVEGKFFAKLLCDPVSRNIIRTTFVNKGEADKLVRRPDGVPKSRVAKLGGLGDSLRRCGRRHRCGVVGQ